MSVSENKKVSSPKVMSGLVVSAKALKTVAVKVTRTIVDPRLKKIIRMAKTYLVHDDNNCKEGDLVEIQEVRPISKQKKFKVIRVATSGKSS